LAQGVIADTLEARGQLDEALRIRQEEELPVYEKLGEIRSRAVTMGKIADIFQARGQLDEALRICQEEELPIYKKLGDIRERAVTMGKIANIFQDLGQLDEALRIHREEALPVYEKLGAKIDLLVGRVHLALTYLKRRQPGDREAAHSRLLQALAVARAMRLPEAAQIEAILDRHGLSQVDPEL
jgi:tetratricopeptide (TPR) repeat protein